MGSADLRGTLCAFAALAFAGCGVSGSPAASLTPSPSAPLEPKEGIRWLADDDFARRERAQEALRAAGPDALSALRRAAESEDPEVASRAKALLEEASWSKGGVEDQGISIEARPAKAAFKKGEPIELEVRLVNRSGRAAALEMDEAGWPLFEVACEGSGVQGELGGGGKVDGWPRPREFGLPDGRACVLAHRAESRISVEQGDLPPGTYRLYLKPGAFLHPKDGLFLDLRTGPLEIRVER